VVPVVVRTRQRGAQRATAAVSKAPGQRPSARRNRPSKARHGKATASDAIAFLKADHRQVDSLFKSFEKAGERAYRTKRKLVDGMIVELSKHAALEEQFFYPAVRRSVPEAGTDVLEAMEEHHIVKWILSELLHLDAEDERFDPKVTVLMESVRHHVREEETELFPEVRANMARRELLELGEKLAEGQRLAPTRPHPRSPDEPPGNLIAGAVIGVMDRARTAVKSK
jgi:hemerythrin superfamily protein